MITSSAVIASGQATIDRYLRSVLKVRIYKHDGGLNLVLSMKSVVGTELITTKAKITNADSVSVEEWRTFRDRLSSNEFGYLKIADVPNRFYGLSSYGDGKFIVISRFRESNYTFAHTKVKFHRDHGIKTIDLLIEELINYQELDNDSK